MIKTEEKERKLTITTRYVSEEMIIDFHNHDLTLTDFIKGSNNNDRAVNNGGFLDVPIKIYIPEQEEEEQK